LKIIFQQLLSFFCQQHPFFQLLFKRFPHFALVESTASTLAAAVSTASPISVLLSVASYFIVSFFLQETSTKVATRANPKMLHVLCFSDLH
jgi:hypothetical protein